MAKPAGFDRDLQPEGKSQNRNATGTSHVFVRESTGLVKSVSLLDAVSLNISNMSAGAALGVLGFTMINLPSVSGLNLVAASLIAFLLAIPQVVVYTMMSRRIPRAGGDYVWISRTLGGWLGAPISFAGYTLETLAYLALISISAVFAIGSVLVAMGYQVGLGLALPSYLQGSSPAAQMIIAMVVFGALITLNIFRPKAGYKLVSVLTAYGLFSIILSIAVLLYSGRSGIISFVNSLGAQGITYQSLTSSYTGPLFNFGTVMFMLPFFAAFVYPWLNAAPAVASEIKGGRALKLNIPVSAVLVVTILTAALGTMYYVGGFGFINEAMSNPTLVLNYSLNFWTLAMGVSPSPVLAWLIGAGWIVWNLAVLAYGIIVFSRYLFAQAFDRFLPEKLAYVSPKYGSPVIAHVIDLVITFGLIGLAVYFYGSLQALFGAIVISMVYFGFIGVAAAVYALRKERGATRGALALSGSIMVAYFAFLTYEFLANHAVWGVDTLSLAYVGASVVAGFLLYGVARSRNSKRGIDISLAYKEVPPE